jgi:ABC-2 type transport system ATP-binding protein
VSIPALKIDGLVKRYGDFTAVDGISFEVAEGAFFGLLGPNGAGKTTTINAIVGLAKVTAGSIALFGHDVAIGGSRAGKSASRRRNTTSTGISTSATC